MSPELLDQSEADVRGLAGGDADGQDHSGRNRSVSGQASPAARRLGMIEAG